MARRELFGPVLSVFRAESFAEALETANDSEYALTGGVYSRSPSHVELARRHFRVGNLYINRETTGAMVDRQPFGGLRMSGGGTKAGGPGLPAALRGPAGRMREHDAQGARPRGQRARRLDTRRSSCTMSQCQYVTVKTGSRSASHL